MTDANRNREQLTLLEHITTHWPTVADPARFVLRYASPIRAYLISILRQAGDTEDVAQDFLLKVLSEGFFEDQVKRGRFRDYLRAAIRNAAITHLRKKKVSTISSEFLETAADDPTDWIDEWRQCLLDKSMQQLEVHQRQSEGNLYFTAIRLTIDYPGEDSQALAQRANGLAGSSITAAGFRKHLSRGRQKLAEIIVGEVRQTISHPSPEAITDELCELGLFAYVEDYISEVL